MTPLTGSVLLVAVTLFTVVVGLNLSAMAAGVHPLLTVVTLLVTLLVAMALVDRLGERWAPGAMHAFHQFCRSTVRRIRAD